MRRVPLTAQSCAVLLKHFASLVLTPSKNLYTIGTIALIFVHKAELVNNSNDI